MDRSIAPNIIDTVNIDLQLKPYQSFNLDNGIPVYTVDAGSQEVLMLEFVFFAGNCYETKNIVAASTNFLLKNGTSTKNAFAINEHFEFYGAYFNRSCYNETATLTLHTLSKHLPELLPMIQELLLDAVFPEQELAIYQQNQKQRLAVNLKKCDFIANRLIDEYLYGLHHPYGKYTSTIDYDALNRNELVEFFKTYYQQGHCKIFVAGKLPNNVETLLNTNFGSMALSKNMPALPLYNKQSAIEKKHNVVNDENGVQGSIRFAKPLFNRHHPDFPAIQVLNNIFGGFFGSRLMENIREDKGYTYGIYSYLQNHLQDSSWMISTEAGRDVCEATIEETYKEMLRLQNEMVDTEELDLVRNYMMGMILGDLDGPFQIISRWKTYILNDLTEEYFHKSIHTIKNITPEELQALAKKYLKPEDFYELVVV